MGEITCDVCGNNEATAIVLIEGAKIAACRFCARSGKILYRLHSEEQGAPAVATRRVAPMESEEIVDGYARIIADAMTRMKLPIAVVAERISEKESYIHSIERGKLKPTLQTARKLEKELGVKLVEKVTDEVVPMSSRNNEGFRAPTLGDAIEFQKKEKKGK